MKKFVVTLHWYKGGTKRMTIWAETHEQAIENAVAQCPAGYAVKAVKMAVPKRA